jgi:colanic acid biosynthesis glycosyl transferase WcaI
MSQLRGRIEEAHSWADEMVGEVSTRMARHIVEADKPFDPWRGDTRSPTADTLTCPARSLALRIGNPVRRASVSTASKVAPMSGCLRIVVHDYSGHPCQVQLSRELAQRGHSVVHQHCPSYTTGKGALQTDPDDGRNLTIAAVPMYGAFRRYSPLRRVVQEVAYGVSAGRAISSQTPDIAVLSNIPLISHWLVFIRLRIARVPMVLWHQDIYSAAIGSVAIARLGLVGRVIAQIAGYLERAITLGSRRVVAIADSFLEQYSKWQVSPERIFVIPNWAPIDELPLRPKSNEWSQKYGLSEPKVVLYSGTLGLKHDPEVLAELARRFECCKADIVVAVVSEGRGREHLEKVKEREKLTHLRLIDYQPYERLPEVLGSATVLLVLLEESASQYSVPSKALAYLCAGRPIAAVLPASNPVARIVQENNCGVVLPSADHGEVVREIEALVTSDSRCGELGDNARDYAEHAFVLSSVVDRFESLLMDAYMENSAPRNSGTKLTDRQGTV